MELRLISDNQVVLSESSATQRIAIGFCKAYQDGDHFEIELDAVPAYLMVRLDDALGESLVYVTKKMWKYVLPVRKEKDNLPEFAFRGENHYISVRYAESFEIYQYQNLSTNSYDLPESDCVFPHASANVETRNESNFFAVNAINGIYANAKHEGYPYSSWGINRREDACFKLDFGRIVEVDRVDVTLRADFPHDSYWTSGELLFSNGEKETIFLNKVSIPQKHVFNPKKVEWVLFTNLRKNFDDSPFPALTEFDCFGKNISQ